MKKLSLVLASALLLGSISFAQTTTKKAPAKKGEKKTEMKKSTKTEKKSTKGAKSTKKTSKKAAE